jgi:hypothetical protein
LQGVRRPRLGRHERERYRAPARQPPLRPGPPIDSSRCTSTFPTNIMRWASLCRAFRWSSWVSTTRWRWSSAGSWVIPRRAVFEVLHQKFDKGAHARGNHAPLRSDCIYSRVRWRIVGQYNLQAARAQIVPNVPRGMHGYTQASRRCIVQQLALITLYPAFDAYSHC